jgi:hypothetical protein
MMLFERVAAGADHVDAGRAAEQPDQEQIDDAA